MARYKKKHVLSVSVHADERLAHYVSDCVSYGEWRADKHKFGLAFTLRVNRYISITEDSAVNRLVN